MVVVTSGTNKDGTPCEFYMDGYLQKAFDEVKQVVGTQEKPGKNWDYISIVAGMPGVGKSNFAQNCARYCCPWFDETYIAFTADQFIQITNDCPRYSAVVLDESFASLNARVSMSGDFLKIVNHLQLLRQKNLYIFLCLPNFFDLAKGIAIYRSHHLFVVYSESFGERGTFCAFNRETKKKLYIIGGKFMDYNCVQSNFHGKFVKSKCVDEAVYDKLKLEHLMQQGKHARFNKPLHARNLLIHWIKKNCSLTDEQIGSLCGLDRTTIVKLLQKQPEELEE